MQLSKSIKNGDIVKLHGNKYVRFGRQGGNPNGIFFRENTQTIHCVDGEIRRIKIPEGVMLQGQAAITVTQLKKGK